MDLRERKEFEARVPEIAAAVEKKPVGWINPRLVSMKELPKDHWILWNIHIITLGRTICTARNPKCSQCFLRELCPSAGGMKG